MNGKTLAIRDLRVNAHGDVFMLYTLDSGSGWYINEPQSLTDDHGNTYLRVFSEPLRPTEDVWGNSQKFLSENNQSLKVAWWIPLHPLVGGAKAWNPTRFTITLRTGDPFYGFQNRGSSKPWMQTVKFSIPVYDGRRRSDAAVHTAHGDVFQQLSGRRRNFCEPRRRNARTTTRAIPTIRRVTCLREQKKIIDNRRRLCYTPPHYPIISLKQSAYSLRQHQCR